MAQLFNKTLNRVFSVFFAVIMLFGAVFMFSSCQNSNAKVTMNISFEGKTYSIAYKLYKTFFPQTVQHFIELADAGYYDGLCFHDYQETVGMYSGGYEYDETAAGDDVTRGLKEREYFSWIEENEVELTQSVYKYVEEGTVPTEGTNTLVGEFEHNNYSIKNNDKKMGAKKVGGLVMYYTDKSEVTSTNVSVKRNNKREETDEVKGDARWYDTRSYAKNSATSLFYVSFESSEEIDQDYCVFGELYNDGAQEKYDELMAAISAYINKNVVAEDDSFTETTGKLSVDTGDWYYKSRGLSVKYEVPVTPIVIKSVKVNRY